MDEMTKRLKRRWNFALAAFTLLVGGYLHFVSAAEPDTDHMPQPRNQEILFDDYFERDDLGEEYSVVNPDPNRLIISDGKLLIVATEPRKNLVLLQKNFSDDFVATVTVTMQLTEDNYIALYYWVDERNLLAIGFAASSDNQRLPWERTNYYSWDPGRRPFFTKIIEKQINSIVPTTGQLGERELGGFSSKPEKWYLQLQREGSKYTGRVSADGIRWTRLGTHLVVQNYGQLGLGTAISGGGIENVAEFDDLVVQGSH